MDVRFLPLSVSAFRLGISRERMLRLVTTRRVEGAFNEGRWVVVESSLEHLERERSTERPEVLAGGAR